ncbi:MAG TPA: pilus assembly protein TadG-related protein [Actinomycetota bacterium]|nr:pilus assembly protein TadG-related protein [Actinomycetota bacterium]
MNHHHTLRRAPSGEDGATLIIVTLSLLALFGMMVLVVDVGSLLYARRAMVNAADAAALAAAQSCGQKEGLTEANLQAEFFTVANQSGAVVVDGYPQYFPSCDSPAGLVTVRVTTQRPLFFAPVLGFDSDTPVATEATASWGGAGAGEKVAPLMLSADRLHSTDCDIPPADPAAQQDRICTFWWNNSSRGQANPDLANAEWGTLDLLKWDVTSGVNCDNSTPPQFQEWMLEGFELPLPIDSDFYGAAAGDTHTYVCRGQGNFGNALDTDIEAAACPVPGDPNCDPLYFPVNRPSTQIDSMGDVCSPDLFATTNCAVDKYDIIGFARLYIVDLIGGGSEKAQAVEECSHVPGIEEDANARCMIARWEGYTPEGLDPQGGENFGLVPVRLVA